ncbi:Methyl-accepting chemotaxis protein [Rubrivivax sp. A210]|uniref:methyl-accepting chemotaxis protein n=1 Tax=Rubrivivax sp. A210 TaxID=2772301 RepID=UPI00191A8F25|nr:methyl-accepting chemotaxis protein [Rubrivivax sp. A210]CAD5374451.1 Methyl-accepting chemotaxis protein [Rubrivivax sp. A210]
MTFFSTFKGRMALLVGSLLLLTALVGGVGWMSTASLASQWATYRSDAGETMHRLIDTQVDILQTRRGEKDMLIRFDRPDAVAKGRKRWEENVAKVDEGLRELAQRAPTPELAARFKDALASFTKYRQGFASVIEGIEKKAYASTGEADKAANPHAEHLRAVEPMIQEALAHTMEREQALAARFDEVTALSRGVLMAALPMAVLLGALGGWLFMRAALRPVHQATAILERIAEGDLTTRVDVRTHDEFGHMLEALAKMEHQLHATVTAVHEGAAAMGVASEELARGNQDLNTRTEQQAASLQETASSMEQMTATLRHSADSAQQARSMGEAASSVAERGGEVMQGVVAVMGEISGSSRRIADIIGTIDGIAFQTNILALNAAVEAARAGEQGRGFAVVATEVRSLAQRSAVAAREIKELIGASVAKVDDGGRMVDQAGQTMGEVVAQVRRVTELIAAISSAAAEQSTGIVQVNQAVSQLDQMTQQNAALVEQSTSAAASLRQQAEQLDRSVSFFQLSAADVARRG